MRQTITRSSLLELKDGRIMLPGTDIGLLSSPGKMPCHSYSLPAIVACPGAAFGPLHICGISKAEGDTSCYATSGRYAFDATLNAQAARYAWTRQALKTVDGTAFWVDYMTAAITYVSRYIEEPAFRWHDSGDVFSAFYGQAIYRVVAGTQDVKHWLPTRSYRVPAILFALEELATLPNIAVKPSALRFGDSAPIIPRLDAGTAAAPTGANCPAPNQGGSCLDCRHCWGKANETTYLAHGNDVHGIVVKRPGHRQVTQKGRTERLAGFLTHWAEHFKFYGVEGN